MKYKSSKYKEAYENFLKAFEQEGDVYDSIKESIIEEYEHKAIPTDVGKTILLNILKEAFASYLRQDVEVLTEKEYLKTIKYEKTKV